MNDNSNKFTIPDKYIKEASMYPEMFVGRIIMQSKDLYKISTGNNELIGEVLGKFRKTIKDISEYPVVGDFVIIDRDTNENGNAIIHKILNRSSLLIRKAAGTSNQVQAIASNVDIFFICMSLNLDFNLRRLERYISIVWDSGAKPVIILTKKDLCQNVMDILVEVEKISLGIDVIVTSIITEDGFQIIYDYLKKDTTVGFIGSSGVGKSTLINKLVGNELINTSDIRKDDRGRHTTTRREMFFLKNNVSIIDTPGMREIGLESVNLNKTFSDIEELAKLCKYKNCSHENEPHCAVKEAIDNGVIDKERLDSYLKLSKESKYIGMNSKQIEKDKIENMFSSFSGIKNAKKYIKTKNKYED